ncbi:MAG TPA: CHRD domain-containing protein [Pseudolabrys sp.]|nr:CHRD domain-containing protein [Pseudolabrys sp.]
MTHSVTRRAVCALAALACMAWAGAAAAAPTTMKVSLNGAQQVPPVKTDGGGTADLTWDPSTSMIKWHITYSHMSSPVTMAHFHQGADGKNGSVEIWLTKKGKPVSSPITGEAKLTAAEAKHLMAGDWYINVHTKKHPAGEIRGQVKPSM